MTRSEWESLCDGCGRCCLQKLENRKTGRVDYTWISCYLLDTRSCRCSDYDIRTILVPSCVILKPDNVQKLRWLPKTCAYRLLSEGKPLYDWHPLVSGNPSSVHESGISIRDQAVSEEYIHPDDFEYYIMDERI